MKRRWARWWMAAVLLAIIIAGVGGYLHTAPAPVPKATASTVVPVSTARVGTASMADRVTSYGNLVPVRSVEIVPNAPGQIQKILFADGEEVAAGTPLVVMDSRIAQAQVQSARAQAGAHQQNLKRTQSLQSQGLDSTYSLEQAQAQAAASQATLQIDLQRLDELTLRAPFRGTLGRRKVDVGAFLNSGQNIVRLDDTSQLRIEFRMPSSVTGRVTEDMPVYVELPEAHGPAVNGKLSFIDPAVSTDTRSVLLRAVVPNSGSQLRPGLYARVRLDLDVHPNALVVPDIAVSRDLGGAYVYLVDDNDIAHKRTITPGIADRNLVEVLAGLKAGDQVVTVGQFRLHEGDRVTIVPEQPEAKGSS
ncbi:MAG: efflux RND transporter periplasmic adaptor subunit [Thiohalocapsa sp.]